MAVDGGSHQRLLLYLAAADGINLLPPAMLVVMVGVKNLPRKRQPVDGEARQRTLEEVVGVRILQKRPNHLADGAIR